MRDFHCLSAYMVSPAYIPTDLSSLFHNPRRQILHFYFFSFFFFCMRILDIFFKKLSRNISSICLENAGQSWGCLEYETLTGVPNVISFRAWNQAGILLLSQGPMPFLKKRTDLKFLQIRIYLVIGPLCMKESERKSLHGSLSHSHQNLRRKVSHLKVQWKKKRIL